MKRKLLVMGVVPMKGLITLIVDDAGNTHGVIREAGR